MIEGHDRAHLDQAVTLLRAGKVAPARAILDLLAARYPDETEIALVLGSVLLRGGDADSALPHFQRVAERAPALGVAHLNVGICQRALGRLDDAVQAFRAARKVRPGDGLAAFHTIRTLVEIGDIVGAVAEHRAASAALVDLEYLPSLASALLPEMPHDAIRMNAARDAYEQAVANMGAPRATVPEQRLLAVAGAFFAAYQGRPNRAQQRQIADYYAGLCPDLTRPILRPVKTSAKIRVGFASAHLNNHTIGKLTRGLIAHLDRDQFEVFVFSTQPADDEIGRYIAQHCDGFTVLPQTLADARWTIAETALDVLIYPDIGMEPLCYFLGFARLAAVQCVMWGHPVTTGIPAIDYFLSGRDLESADPIVAQAQYSERLIRFAGLPTYLYPVQDSTGEFKPDLGFARDAHIYVCPQQPVKFHPDFDPAFIDILRRDPNGVLVLLDLVPRLTNILRARLARTGADVADRIHFVPRLGQAGFLELLKASHVVLDTWPFSGGISSAEALGLGKIVVTLPHPDLMAGRVTASYYRQMDIDFGVARDLDDYVRIVVRFGTDEAARAAAERRIGAAKARLFRRDDAVRELERFCLDAVTKAD